MKFAFVGSVEAFKDDTDRIKGTVVSVRSHGLDLTRTESRFDEREIGVGLSREISRGGVIDPIIKRVIYR